MYYSSGSERGKIIVLVIVGFAVIPRYITKRVKNKGGFMKADKWEFKTILSIEFKCKNCSTIYKIDKDVTVDRYETDKFIVHCGKCKFVNEVER